MKLNHYKSKYIKGFSLIEVLVFVSILGVFFVGAIGATIASLKNMKVNENRILATHYAEELMEWLKSEKEINWTEFVVNAQQFPPARCREFPDSQQITWTGACDGADYDNLEPQIYYRTATFEVSGSPATEVKVDVVVSWNDSGTLHRVPVTTVLTNN